MLKLMFFFWITFASNAGQEENFDIFSSTFSKAIGRLLQSKWQSDSLETFRHDFANVTKKLLNSVLFEYYAYAARFRLKPFQTEYNTRLLIYSGENLTGDIVNENLIQLTSTLCDYFRRLPNEKDSTSQVFKTPLPLFQKVEGRRNYDLVDSFVNLDKYLDNTLRRYYGLFGNLFLEGWKATRPILKSVKNRYAKTYLYGVIMERLVSDIEKVRTAQQVIQSFAKRNVWDNFTTNADRLLTLYEKFHSR